MGVFLFLKLIVSGFILGVTIVAPVGPTAIETIKRTVIDSHRSGFMVGLGAVVADMLILILVLIGLAPLVFKIKVIRVIYHMVGFTALFLTGILSIRKSITKHMKTCANNQLTAKSSFVTGFILTVANPMSLILWLALFGTVISHWARISFYFETIFIVSIMLGMLSWFYIIARLAGYGQNLLINNVNRINLLAGIAMLAFSGIFLLKVIK